MLSGVTGLNNTGWYPPDTGVAAGPNYVVETANERMAIYNKTTGTLVSTQNLGSLFSGSYMGSLGPFDPQVLYDDSANRFVIAAPVTSSTSSGPYTAYIDFAVSNSSDPTAGWTTRQIEVDQGGTNWVDNGKLGYNADAWVYSGNRYGNAGGVMMLSIDKSSVANSTWTSYLVDASGFSTIPARMHGAVAGGPMWFVESNWGGGSSVTILKMANVLSSNPNFTTSSLPTSSYGQSTITQPGGTIGFDCRTLGAEWYNNNLVAAWNSQAGSDAAAFWIEFNTGGSSPAVAQQGIVHPATGISTSMPAIAVDVGGDIGLTYIQSSSTQYASTYITGRLASDPLNTMEGSVLVQAGNASLSGSRIGDYAGMSIDPSSSNTFWAANEYGLSGVTGNWGSAIAQFQMATNSNVTPPTITTAASANPDPAGQSTALSVRATDSSNGTDLTYTWSVLSGPSATFSVNNSNAANSTTAMFSAAGSYTFQVAVSNAGGTVTSSVAVTVTQTPTSIAVSPSTVSLADGSSQQFTATERDQFGKAMLTQPTFTWSVSPIGNGSITTAGLYTAPSTGSSTATISAVADNLQPGNASVTYGTVPAAPSSLTATAGSATRVNLTWTDNSNNETGFIIQRSSNGGGWSQIATVGAGATSYSDTTVRKKQKYQYRVLAYNTYGNSAWSNVATVNTPNRGPAGADDELPVVWVNASGGANGRARGSSDSNRTGATGSAVDVAIIDLLYG